MPDRLQILRSIRALAKRLHRPPRRFEFVAATRISEHRLSQFFPGWNAAILAAGLQPYTINAPIDDAALLRDWGSILRRRKVIPGFRLYSREGKYSVRTMENRFGGWKAVPQAFRHFARGRREWADVLALLPDPPSRLSRRNDRPANHPARVASLGRAWHPQLKGQPTFGNPIFFPGLLHEPLNEQGVVLLFGMLAKDLGYLIESVQTGFPDCHAKRQIAPGRWQRVRIEFEYESKSFRAHGHPADRCDLIVCWRHNWPHHPRHLQILELSSLLQKI